MLRYNPYENVLSASNVGKLRVKWRYSQGWPIASAPAVADGTLYIASYKGLMYAFKLTTGAMLWSYSFTGGVSSSPAVWGMGWCISAEAPITSGEPECIL